MHGVLVVRGTAPAGANGAAAPSPPEGSRETPFPAVVAFCSLLLAPAISRRKAKR